MGLIATGCCRLCRQPINTTIVPSCPPVMLVEPTLPIRPDVILRYKIEEKKEWFAMDKDTYISVRDYIIQMEGVLEFVIKEIRASNKSQNMERTGVP